MLTRGYQYRENQLLFLSQLLWGLNTDSSDKRKGLEVCVCFLHSEKESVTELL